MKDVLNQFYEIDLIGIITISKKVYKIKTSNGFYAVKKVYSKESLEHYKYINSLHLDCFVPLIPNKNGELLTVLKEEYIYVMPWITTDDFVVKELKLRHYFHILSVLHNSSFYSLKVHKGYFKSIVEHLREMITTRIEFYGHKLQLYELNYFKSPSEWQFILNFPVFREYLNNSLYYLEKFETLSESLTSVRLCLVYMNFDVKHISLQRNMLLSIDKMRIDLPIYDLYDLFVHQDTIVFENELLVEHYLKKFQLYDYEKILLACLLSCVPLVEFSKDEVDNVIRITRVLNYIDSINQFIVKLNIPQMSEKSQ